jgi:hypothetical protein
MTEHVRLRPLSHATAGLVGAIKEVRVDPSVPTCAVAVVQGEVVFYAGVAYQAIPDYGTEAALDPRQAEADYQREQMLRHEAHHVALDHPARRDQRDPGDWNLVCDAAIHHTTSIDLKSLAESIGGEVVEFSTLDIQPLPPEMAYEVWRDKQRRSETGGAGGAGEGCGRPTDESLRNDHPATPRTRKGTPKAESPIDIEERKARQRALQDAIVDGIAVDRDNGRESVDGSFGAEPDNNEGGTTGTGGRTGTLARQKMPPWVDTVLQLMETGGPKTKRQKSYRREHREQVEFLPGRTRTHGSVATIMVDASGSMRAKDLGLFMAALHDSRFSESDVFVFDTHCHGPISASDTTGVEGLIKRCGGGTDLLQAWTYAEPRADPANVRVWFTDGEDGNGALPPDREQDIWIYVPWSGDIEVCDRKRMNKLAHKRGD